jgi:hypothetical protein
MKHSEVLREAKKFLRTDLGQQFDFSRHTFICLAVDKVKSPATVRKQIKQYINELLNPTGYELGACTYEEWLVDNGYMQWGREPSYEIIQALRLCWMDWMIEQYEAIGK